MNTNKVIGRTMHFGLFGNMHGGNILLMAQDIIRILIVDDHQVVRIGLRTIIERQRDMEVVAEADNGMQAIESFRKHHPDITLMDLRMKGMTGAEATAAICKEFPAARILVLSNYDGDEDIYRALHSGARGYLLKEMADDEILQAIRTILTGKRYVPPVVGTRLAERAVHCDLTDRELEVLRCIVNGKSNKEIAAFLKISEGTVKIHVNNILSKLGVDDRTQAATIALRRGIVYLE